MPAVARPSRVVWLFRIGVPAGWTVFTLIVIGITWASYAMQGRPSTFRTLFIQYLGLFLWGIVTFLVVYLVRRWPLARKDLPRHGFVLAVTGLGLVIALVGLEYALGHALGAQTTYLGLLGYKAYIYLLIYWMIVGATTAYDNHVRYRESQLLAAQLETQLAHSELHALRMQLQPHFLFNAHHAIVSLVLKGDGTGAVKMLTRLSDLLRLTLARSHRQVVALEEELEMLDLYLGIQKERYRDRLQVEVVAAADTLVAEVPSLLLQPIVENAFKHGIDTLSIGGVLRIRSWRQDRVLCLSVFDNGPGCTTVAMDEDAPGLGLRNTRARLRGHYGADQQLDVLSEPDGGTEIRIMLPYKAHQPDGAEAEGVAE